MKSYDILSKTTLFNGKYIGKFIWKKIIREYIDPNEVLFEEGQDANYLCIVETGSLIVFSGGERLAEINPGECIGEMALIEGSTRSAMVKSGKEGASILKLSEENFFMLIKSPYGPLFLINLFKSMNNKLNKSNIRIKNKSSIFSKLDENNIVSKGTPIKNKFKKSWENSKNLSICSTLSVKKLLETGNLLHFDAIRVIFKKGDKCDNCYLLLEGKVDVMIDNLIVAELCSSEMFGLMGLFGVEGRSATIVSKTNCICIKFSFENINSLFMEDSEFILAAIRNTSYRIKMSNKTNKFSTSNIYNDDSLIKKISLQFLDSITDKFKKNGNLYKQFIWKEDEKSERRISDISIDQVIRSLATTECIIPEIVSINGVVMYDELCSKKPVNRLKFLSVLISGLCISGIDIYCNFEEIIVMVIKLIGIIRKTEKDMKEFEEKHQVKWINILRLCSFNCWGYADHIIRNNLPLLFKQPYYTRKQQGIEYHIQIFNSEMYGVTLQSKYLLSRGSIPIALINFSWTVIYEEKNITGKLFISNVEFINKTKNDEKYINDCLKK